MKNLKRTAMIGLTATMVITSFAGCGSKSGTTNETTTVASSTAETESTTEAVVSKESAAEAAKEADVAEVDIVNDYNNTAELLKKFPVVNQTPVSAGIGEQIENRLLTGFENWNRGFDAWKAWGDILYTEDSIYNVHGARLTLNEYQDAMDVMLKQMDMIMGDFNNMVICDDWAAIHYDITTVTGDKQKPGTVMEFVQFKDYGDELGTRVVEGWGGPKDASFDSMTHFQSDEEKALQQEQIDEIINYEIPDTDDLEAKYPVKNKTTDNSDKADMMRAAILKDFDAYNNGIDVYAMEAQDLFTDDALITVSGDKYDKVSYIDLEKTKAEATKTTKLYFDNMLISGDWAAIHYRVTNEDAATGEKEAADKMEFFRFTEDGKVDICYKK